uniref:Ig-like domain-containing protein n=1 Tax=Rhabditophanes sp. KR3021 TaxID=114890 RepID=A0AC35U5G7_9BILA
MPDIVPGPPEVWFVKDEIENVRYGQNSSDTKFIATSDALQIYSLREADAGKYFCVVRNVYTNQIRKSTKPIILNVSSSSPASTYITKQYGEYMNTNYRDDKMIWPLDHSSKDNPIQVHAVINTTFLIECFLEGAHVRWFRGGNRRLPLYTVQEGSNLRFLIVTESHAGIYLCEPTTGYGTNETYFKRTSAPPKYFDVIVHQPSRSTLIIKESIDRNEWTVSCTAEKLLYEVPQMYSEGEDLLELVSNQLTPIAPLSTFYKSTIFFSAKKSVLKGSIQCISRTAMEEAEVYGDNLNIGHSMNYYLVQKTQEEMFHENFRNITRYEGESFDIICPRPYKAKYVPYKTKYIKNGITLNEENWGDIKERLKYTYLGKRLVNITTNDQGWYGCYIVINDRGKENSHVKQFYVTIYPLDMKEIHIEESKQAELLRQRNEQFKKDFKLSRIDQPYFDFDIENVTLHWSTEHVMPSVINNITSFAILTQTNAVNAKWMVDSVVSANTTSTNLLVKDGTIQVKLHAMFGDNLKLESPTTSWISFATSGNVSDPETMYELGSIFFIPISNHELRLDWNFNDEQNETETVHNLVLYEQVDNLINATGTLEAEIEGHINSITLQDLQPATTYKARIIVQASMITLISHQVVGTTFTTDSFFEHNNYFFVYNVLKWLKRYMYLILPVIFLTLLTVAFFKRQTILYYRDIAISRWRSYRKHQASGKFLDTSLSVYNEQNIEKTKLYQAVMSMALNNDQQDVSLYTSSDEYDPLQYLTYNRSGRLPVTFANYPQINIYQNVPYSEDVFKKSESRSEDS